MNNQLKYWLALNKIPVLGSIRIQKLIAAFGEVKRAWEAGAFELSGVEGIGSKLAYEIEAGRSQINLDEEIEKLEGSGISVLTLEDSDYPELLKNIYDPPPVLYFKGKLETENKKTLAIVGTRKASDYGIKTANRLAKELAQAGFSIVSGLALGIDAAAHCGALEAGSETLAVLGSGVDNVYPLSNRALAQDIVKRGALISEFPLGTPPERWHFPMRNRIIAGLSLGVIVVEGGYDSGSMITAKLALEQGREVFAVPGRIDNDLTRGPHWLIKQGAKLVEKIDDILEEFNMVAPERECQIAQIKSGIDYSRLSADEQKIIEALKTSPCGIDQMLNQLNFSTSTLLSLLTILELQGILKKVNAQKYALV
jgi:DNA processing protein